MDYDHLMKHKLEKSDKCNFRRGPPGTKIYHDANFKIKGE